MNTSIILAGGSGSRMKTTGTPKQYIFVQNKPIISYCLDTFQKADKIHKIIIVAEEDYYEFLQEWIQKQSIDKFVAFALPGKTRQHSIYSGLKKAKEFMDTENDIVIIHDSARPLVSEKIINSCIAATEIADGAMPVITIKDTIYHSVDGKHIQGLLNRDQLFAGQAPESFRLQKYLDIHDKLSDEEIGHIRGSSEIAYRYGLDIELIAGSEENFKITTMEDLHKFELIMQQ